MFEPMKLLIAYDGSSYADAAQDDLWRCGLPRRAEVVIMSVADVFLPPPSSPETTFPTQVPSGSAAGLGPRLPCCRRGTDPGTTSAGSRAHRLSYLERAYRGVC